MPARPRTTFLLGPCWVPAGSPQLPTGTQGEGDILATHRRISHVGAGWGRIFQVEGAKARASLSSAPRGEGRVGDTRCCSPIPSRWFEVVPGDMTLGMGTPRGSGSPSRGRADPKQSVGGQLLPQNSSGLGKSSEMKGQG